MLSKFERYKLTFGPTPIEKLFRLTAQIFAKREDCNSGLAYGGNKLRADTGWRHAVRAVRRLPDRG